MALCICGTQLVVALRFALILIAIHVEKNVYFPLSSLLEKLS